MIFDEITVGTEIEFKHVGGIFPGTVINIDPSCEDGLYYEVVTANDEIHWCDNDDIVSIFFEVEEDCCNEGCEECEDECEEDDEMFVIHTPFGSFGIVAL